jgi:hypothetical protein
VLTPGEPFLFKTHHPHICGARGGFFSRDSAGQLRLLRARSDVIGAARAKNTVVTSTPIKISAKSSVGRVSTPESRSRSSTIA